MYTESPNPHGGPAHPREEVKLRETLKQERSYARGAPVPVPGERSCPDLLSVICVICYLLSQCHKSSAVAADFWGSVFSEAERQGARRTNTPTTHHTQGLACKICV